MEKHRSHGGCGTGNLIPWERPWQTRSDRVVFLHRCKTVLGSNLWICLLLRMRGTVNMNDIYECEYIYKQCKLSMDL